MRILSYRYYLALLLILHLTIGCSKMEVEPDKSFDITNSANDFQYRIDIVHHNSESKDLVIFVLDPSSMMPIALDVLKSRIKYDGNITLVGIEFKGENKRFRDYTPTDDGKETGEAQAFFNFIVAQLNDELLTRNILDDNTRKCIVGHSLSGLASAYAFCVHNNYFSDYIILSPALYWDSYSLFGIEQSNRNTNSSATSRVFMGIGIQEDLGMQNGFEALSEVLEENYPNVLLKTHLSAGSHMGSRAESVMEGLNYILQ